MAEFELLDTEEATLAAGGRLAGAIKTAGLERVIVYLRGDLGAGKTTFARGFLAGLGHAGRVPSPTYTLVEPYEFKRHTVYHIDLYRLADPGEVDDLALADLDGPGAVLLIEWPERAAGRLEAPDLELTLAIDGVGRSLRCHPCSATGKRLLAHKKG